VACRQGPALPPGFSAHPRVKPKQLVEWTADWVSAGKDAGQADAFRTGWASMMVGKDDEEDPRICHELTESSTNHSGASTNLMITERRDGERRTRGYG